MYTTYETFHPHDSATGGISDGEYQLPSTEYQLPSTECEYSPTTSVVVDGGEQFGVAALSFDPHQELLWMGNGGGHVTSYYSDRLQKYTSFSAHRGRDVRQICPLDMLVLSLSDCCLKANISRGLTRFTHRSANLVNMQCMLPLQGGTSVLLGGHQEKLVCFDLTQTKESQLVDAGDTGCVLLRRHSRYICCGNTAGLVTLRDPRSLRVQHSLETHSVSVNDLDVYDNLLVTCGYSLRGGEPLPDRHLKLYDVRVLRPLTPVPLVIDPYLLQFVRGPGGGRVAVVSSHGQLQLVETAQLMQPTLALTTIDTGGNHVSALDVSTNCRAIAVADTSGVLHLLTLNGSECTFNAFSNETEFADVVDPLPAMSFTDSHACLSSVPAPVHTQTECLSAWWPGFDQPIYRPPPKLDASILSTMRMNGNIGYARNSGARKPNQAPYDQRGDVTATQVGQLSSAEEAVGGVASGAGGDMVRASSAVSSSVCVPRHYRRLDVKYGNFGAADDSERERVLTMAGRTGTGIGAGAGTVTGAGTGTGCSGLENTLPNSYCNSALQVLFHCLPLRTLLYSHLCEREFCLACELSFLFHMLESSSGQVCQASNFLRAFRTIPEATALGLLLSDTAGQSRQNFNLRRLIQNWNRFILQQLDTELSGSTVNNQQSTLEGATAVSTEESDTVTTGSRQVISSGSSTDQRAASTGTVGSGSDRVSGPESLVSALFALAGAQTTRCLRCATECRKRSTALVCDLTYPGHTRSLANSGAAVDSVTESGGITAGGDATVAVSFCDVLATSMCLHQSVQTWCTTCRRYQPSSQTRTLSALPRLLSINCCCDTYREVQFWDTQQQLCNSKLESSENSTSDFSATYSSIAAGGVTKPCRYGSACTRADCRFQHSHQTPVSVVDQSASSTGSSRVSWLPLSITGRLAADGSVVFTPTDSTDTQAETESVSGEAAVCSVVTYDLIAVVSHVTDVRHPDKDNLVATVRVAPVSKHTTTSGASASSWCLFNDMNVVPVSEKEVLWMPVQWKIPAILYYQQREFCSVVSATLSSPAASFLPLSASLLCRNSSDRTAITTPENNSFVPFTTDEIPGKGDLVAMDAEFVTLNQEESEIRSDGTKSTLKPSQMSLARLSCVRGQGPMEGVAFIDEYISTQEQVVDYLTRFSGIRPGDLDATLSSKRLTTLKSSYLKLRFLIDSGVRFVGHGLKNDFRVINLVIPSDQVIDTVQLFHLPQQRMVSLRFLAWHFLNLNIQSETHDSIEDARTALALYRHYETLLKTGGQQGVFRALQQMYERGRQCGWKPTVAINVTAATTSVS